MTDLPPHIAKHFTPREDNHPVVETVAFGVGVYAGHQYGKSIRERRAAGEHVSLLERAFDRFLVILGHLIVAGMVVISTLFVVFILFAIGVVTVDALSSL